MSAVAEKSEHFKGEYRPCRNGGVEVGQNSETRSVNFFQINDSAAQKLTNATLLKRTLNIGTL